MASGAPPRPPSSAGSRARPTDDGVPTQTYDRVVRIVAWVFLLTTTVDRRRDRTVARDPAGDLRPARLLRPVRRRRPRPAAGATRSGPAKFVVEGSVAITVATLLVALTGGVASPFFFAFPLIVGGAALVVSPPITVALAARGRHRLRARGRSPAPPAGRSGRRRAAIVGVNLTALVLLAYVAMVIAREQRRTRDAAIRLSTVDSLTGLFNRTFFFAAIEREIARSARSGRGFCLLMMDLDELKVDQRPARPLPRRPRPARRRRGHHPRASARSTRRPATAATSSSSSCPRPTRPAPSSWPRRSGSASTRCRIELPGSAPRPSLSIGVVSYPDDGRTADELIISADGAMYASKRAGKDRVTGVPMPGSGATRDAGVASPRERHRPADPRPARRPRLLDPRHPRRLAHPDARPDADERPDLPDRDVRLGRRRRARPRRRPTAAPGYAYSRISNPTTSALGQRLRGARRRRGRRRPGVRDGRDPRRARLAAAGRRPHRRPARDLRLDPAPSCSGTFGGFGVTVDFVDMTDLDAVAAALAAAPTRVLYAETIANPTTFVADHAALADLAHRHGATYVVDNTFASPYVCRPLELGADLVVESATKFLGGHSDVIAGVVAGSGGPDRARVERVQIDTGATLGPLDAFLVLRGILTLAIRVERHAATAAALAAWLERQDGVRAVLYPGPRQPSAARRRAPPVPAGRRRRDARLRGRRRPRRRPGGHRRPAPARADRLARERPHDGRPPAVDVAPPVDRGGAAATPGSRPACSACSVGLEDLEDLQADFARRPRGGSRRSTAGRVAGARRRLGARAIASPAVVSAARTRPSGRNIPARLGYGLWRLFTSVDFAVFQIIFLALLAVVGMTIQQLPDFAFRSATDYAAAMDADPRPLRPGPRRRPSSTSWSGCRSSRSSARRGSALGLVVLVISIVVCTLDRTPQLWRGVSDVRVAQPEPYFDPRLPDRAAMDGVAPRRRPDASCGATASASARRPTRTARAYVYGDRHQYTKMATLFTHLGLILFLVAAAVTSRLGDEQGLVVAEGESLTVQPIGTPGPAARQEPRLRGARLRDRQPRPTSRPTWPSTRTAARSPARRSGSTTRCRSPATRSTRTGSGRRRTSSLRTATGAVLWDAPVPMTDAADGLPYAILGVPGRDLGLQLLLDRPPTGPGVLIVIPYRVVGTDADGQPIDENCTPPVDLQRGDTQVVAGPRPVDRPGRLRRVHAAHRQARSGPGPRLARLRLAHRRDHDHVLPAAPPGLDAARTRTDGSGSSGARTATSTSSASSGACSTSSCVAVRPGRLTAGLGRASRSHNPGRPTGRY